jgi:hypothetical protein
MKKARFCTGPSATRPHMVMKAGSIHASDHKGNARDE